MKKTTILCSIATAILCVAAVPSFTSCKGSSKEEKSASDSLIAAGAIVYFNMDEVLENYDMAKDLGATMESKASGIEQEINRRGSTIEKDMKAFQEKVNKGLMTQSTAEVQYQQLQQRQLEFQQYAQKKQQEINEEAAVTQNQILDAINSYIQEYNSVMGYAMILTTQGTIMSAPVVAADGTLDITKEIIEGLNKAYAQTKAE